MNASPRPLVADFPAPDPATCPPVVDGGSQPEDAVRTVRSTAVRFRSSAEGSDAAVCRDRQDVLRARPQLSKVSFPGRPSLSSLTHESQK